MPSVTYLSTARDVTYIVLRSLLPNVQFEDSPVGTVPMNVPAYVYASTPLLVPT